MNEEWFYAGVNMQTKFPSGILALFCLLVLAVGHLFATEPLILRSFAVLDPHLNQEISLRGFLHYSPDNQWVLSSLPHLKSCCDDRIEVVIDNFSGSLGTNKAVTFAGVLTYNTEDGTYHLNVTSFSTSKRPLWTLWIIGTLCMMGLLLKIALAHAKRKNRQKNSHHSG